MLDLQGRGIAIARYWIHQFGGIAITRICSRYISSSTSGVASVTLYGILSGAAEWDEAKYSPSDPDAESACGHRYQRCGNGGAEDVVTDTISS